MIFGIPGVNGLGKTIGVEKAPDIICNSINLDCKKWSLDNSDIEKQEKIIYDNSREIFNLNRKSIFIGGDHSISYPLAKAFIEKFDEPALIIFDAHYDLMKPMQNPTHEEWLRALVENTGFSNILIVGIRKKSENIDKQEIDFAKDNTIKIIYSDDFEERKNEILEFCKGKNVYLSLDLDVLNSSEFSATGYPEDKGISKKQLIEILRKLKNKFSALDIVEYNPSLDNRDKGLEVVREVLSLFSD